MAMLKKSGRIKNDEGKIDFDANRRVPFGDWEIFAYCDNTTLVEGLTDYLHAEGLTKIRQGSMAMLTNGAKTVYVCDGAEAWHEME